MLRQRIAAAVLGLAASLAASLAFTSFAAAQFPTKAVEIIVSFPAGGSVDLGTRILARGLEEKWKVPVRVVNIPGGNTAPAVDELMRAPPDGYKIMMDLMSSSSLLGIVVPNLPYKVTDRTFLTLAMHTPMTLAVSTASPFKTVEDVVASIKREPQNITWTSLGGTGVVDMAFRRLFKTLEVDVTKTRPVVFRGSAEGAVQLAGGQVMLGVGTYAAYSSLIQAGRVKVLALFASERSKLTPDIPTMVELGYPNTEAVQWNGFSGPPNMPEPIIQAWHEAVQEVITTPAVIEGLARIGIEPRAGDGKEMRAIVEEEMTLLRELFAR